VEGWGSKSPVRSSHISHVSYRILSGLEGQGKYFINRFTKLFIYDMEHKLWSQRLKNWHRLLLWLAFTI